jgi:hypothetical protein
MKNRTLIVIVFMLIGLLALTAYGIGHVSNAEAPAITLIDSNGVTSFSYNFTIFGNTYTTVIVTNSALSNFTLSETGRGVQFQADVPPGTSGFCNVTVPAILIGTDISVFEDGVLLEENVAYTLEQSGTDYIFHLTFDSGIHAFVIEAATTPTQTSTPNPSSTPSQSQNQSNVPLETILTVTAVAAGATISIAVLYFLKEKILHMLGKGGTKALKGAQPPGGGSANVPTGANVTVQPHPNVRLTFSQVNQAGAATATPLKSYPQLPNGMSFRGAVFEITTTAVFAGLVIVGLLFDGKDMSEEEKKKLRVYRNDLKKDSAWEDVTLSVDTKNNIAYGSTDHFSGFGIH